MTVKYEKIILTTAMETYQADDSPKNASMSALDEIMSVLREHLEEVILIDQDVEDCQLIKAPEKE